MINKLNTSKHLPKTLLFLLLVLMLPKIKAQQFWNLTNEFPGGPKTGIAIAEDTCLFVGLTDGVIRSNNDGQNFTSVLKAPAIFTVFASKSGTVFATGAGKIYRTTNLGTSWDTLMLPTKYPISQIIENNEGDLFAITGLLDVDLGYVGDGVLFSENNGVTWEKRNNGLGIYTCCERIAIDQYGKLYLAVADEYVTGNAGLFVSENNGLQWNHIPITIDGQGVVPDQIKIGNTIGLSVSKNDSLYFSFIGTAVNVSVRLNTHKSIHDLNDNGYWKVFKVFDAVSWWLDWPLYNIHFTRNNNLYSSTRGTSNTGGSYFSRNNSSNWEKKDEGLGFDIYGLRNVQYFAEKSDGNIFMIQLLDERIYTRLDTGQPTSIPNYEISTHTIYPNPIKAGLPFSINHSIENEDYTVSIIDINGRKIKSIKATTKELSLNAPDKAGIYLVLIEKQSITSISKLLVH